MSRQHAQNNLTKEKERVNTLKVPASALRFSEDANISLSADAEGKASFSMTAYSGKIIKGHSYWGDLAIDVSGISFNQKRIPILEDHNWDKKLGVSNSLPKIDPQNGVFFEKISLLNNPNALEFKQNLDDGFPYQASISIKPQMVEELEAGVFAEVNGYKMKGPGRIIRKSVFREASACVFGADHRTGVKSLSEEEDTIVEVMLTESTKQTKKENKKEGSINMLNLSAIKETHSELHDKLEGEFKEKEDKIASLTSEITDLKKQISDLEKEKADLSAADQEKDARLAKLEKSEQLRKERDLKDQASGIVGAKLSDSKLPKRLHGRIQKQIDHNAFVGADDVLDVMKFTEHVVAEIDSWKADLAVTEKDETILGFSDHNTDSDTDSEDLADKLVKMATS